MIRERLAMLVRPRTCPVCRRRRRFRWHSDTGCCTETCLRVGLLEAAFSRLYEAPVNPSWRIDK